MSPSYDVSCIYGLFNICVHVFDIYSYRQLPNSTPINLKKRTLLIYRAHQIYNNILASNCRHILFLLISFGAILMISFSYALIGFYDKLPTPALIAAVATCFIALVFVRLILMYSTNLTAASEAFSASYLRNNFKISKINRLHLKASRALYINLGNIAKVRETTFPTVMREVVISRVIDLLLM